MKKLLSTMLIPFVLFTQFACSTSMIIDADNNPPLTANYKSVVLKDDTEIDFKANEGKVVPYKILGGEEFSFADSLGFRRLVENWDYLIENDPSIKYFITNSDDYLKSDLMAIGINHSNMIEMHNLDDIGHLFQYETNPGGTFLLIGIPIIIIGGALLIYAVNFELNWDS